MTKKKTEKKPVQKSKKSNANVWLVLGAFAVMAGIFHPPTPRAGSMGRRGRGGE